MNSKNYHQETIDKLTPYIDEVRRMIIPKEDKDRLISNLEKSITYARNAIISETYHS